MIRHLPDLREIRPTAVLVLLAGLGINLTTLFLVNQPLGAAVLRADEQVRKLRDDLGVRRDEVAYLSEARDWIDVQANQVGLFFDEILSGKSERMVAVQRELREIGRRNNIKTDTISYTDAPVDGTDDMVRFTASFPLTGNYGALRAFIRDVETARNFLIVDSVELQNSREGGVILSLVINVSTIFRDPDYRVLRNAG